MCGMELAKMQCERATLVSLQVGIMATLSSSPPQRRASFFSNAMWLSAEQICGTIIELLNDCVIFSGEAAMRIVGVLTAVLVSVAFGPLTCGAANVSGDSPYDLQQAAGASDYENLEAVLDSSLGQIVIEFFPKEV